jgi:hypothetical protein
MRAYAAKAVAEDWRAPMLRDALQGMVEAFAPHVGDSTWHALEDARQALAQTGEGEDATD